MDYSYLKQKKILLVDDEEEILTMVTGFLREDGYTQIRTASTVADAFRCGGSGSRSLRFWT